MKPVIFCLLPIQGERGLGRDKFKAFPFEIGGSDTAQSMVYISDDYNAIPPEQIRAGSLNQYSKGFCFTILQGLSMTIGKSKNEKPLIFLVDDDEAVLDALKLSLTLDGFEVASYASSPDFLEAFDENRPGCLVIDLCMPEIDGLAVQQELLRRNIDLPIIFISGQVVPRDDVDTLNANKLNFLEKPFRRSALLANIRTALNQKPNLSL